MPSKTSTTCTADCSTSVEQRVCCATRLAGKEEEVRRLSDKVNQQEDDLTQLLAQFATAHSRYGSPI